MQFLIDESLQQKPFGDFINMSKDEVARLAKKNRDDELALKQERNQVLRHARRRERGEESDTDLEGDSDQDEEEEIEEEGKYSKRRRSNVVNVIVIFIS